MKRFYKLLGLFIILLFQICFSQGYPDEIIFHSNGSTFSPLITIQGDATILWTFDDSTTSTLANPTKDYGTERLRINRLKVTPWSAVRGINIGYDASDGGSDSIPLVSNQKVSNVEQLDLVAPYLELWCSSYNLLDSLNFDNFINLKTVECYSSTTVQKVSLKNTPSLKRLCLEVNDLKTLDLSECTGLEDLRTAINNYKDITFSNSTDELWHLCVRDVPSIENPSLFSNIENFPAVKELYIWNTNQSGTFAMHKTTVNSITIIAYSNNYTELDFSGAFQNEGGWAGLYFDSNKLNSVNLLGCVNIGYINLRYNQLAADSVDKVLQQLDELGTNYRMVDLRDNSIPTSTGLSYKASLEAKNWTVYVQTGSEINISGNGVNITNSDTTSTESDLTDFDSVKVTSGSVAHNFIIKNTGTTPLQLFGSAPYVSISGTDASDFSITSEPSTLIPAGDSTTFQITFDPSEIGLLTATVSISHDDWDNNPFTFNIQGIGISSDMTSIESISSTPNKYELSQNYPNPFNPTTKIRYTIPTPLSSSPLSKGRNEVGFVSLKVYDVLGNEVATLVNEEKPAGSYEVDFNATNLPSGIYFYKLQSGSFVQTRKMILLK